MPNDVYQLIMRGNCAGQFWETTQNYESGVASTSNPVTTADNLITAFRSDVEPAIADALAVDNLITGYTCKRVNNGGSPTVMRPITPVPGTVSGTSATSALAYLIVSEFSHLSKYKCGKWFIPGIPEAYLVGNTYNGTGISAAASIIAANASFTGGGDNFTFGVWSRKFKTFFHPQYVHLSSKIGIQKRRLLPLM